MVGMTGHASCPQDQNLARFFQILENAWTIPESGGLEDESPSTPVEAAADDYMEPAEVKEHPAEKDQGHGLEKGQGENGVENQVAAEDRKRKPEEEMAPPPVPQKLARKKTLSPEEVEARMQALMNLGFECLDGSILSLPLGKFGLSYYAASSKWLSVNLMLPASEEGH